MPVKFRTSGKKTDVRMVLGRISKTVEENIKTVLRQEAVPHLIDLIMKGFDSLADRANQLPEDPTNPANWREEFRLQLQKDLDETFVVKGTRIEVKLGDKEFLGYTDEEADPHDSRPLRWMVYYIEGLADDWAFISPETYEELKGRDYDPEWGRFAEGFMINRKAYFAQGFHKIVPFDTVRHPFSGFSPLDIFAEALREFRLRPFISKAIKAAVQGKKL